MTKPKLFMALAGICLAAGAAHAQNEAGAQEYVQACASCHGIDGKGDGPVAEYMSVEVPDLTQLAARNNGEFPTLAAIQVIDGRTGVRGHGDQMMPIWGDRFAARVPETSGDYTQELIVRGRIAALVEHLQAIQEE